MTIERNNDVSNAEQDPLVVKIHSDTSGFCISYKPLWLNASDMPTTLQSCPLISTRENTPKTHKPISRTALAPTGTLVPTQTGASAQRLM